MLISEFLHFSNYEFKSRHQTHVCNFLFNKKFTYKKGKINLWEKGEKGISIKVLRKRAKTFFSALGKEYVFNTRIVFVKRNKEVTFKKINTNHTATNTNINIFFSLTNKKTK